MSRSKTDQLGKSIRRGPLDDDQLRALDQYRRSFGSAYDEVIHAARLEFGLLPSGRPAKSTKSIVDKLRRESIRLSQMQDIAGCRVVVDDLAAQDAVVGQFTARFSTTVVSDRRAEPSHGYRAVHLIVEMDDKLVEVQVRTELQHLWAELSEKLSDIIDPEVKYGGGPDDVRKILSSMSTLVASHEELESSHLVSKITYQNAAEALRPLSEAQLKLDHAIKVADRTNPQHAELLAEGVRSLSEIEKFMAGHREKLAGVEEALLSSRAEIERAKGQIRQVIAMASSPEILAELQRSRPKPVEE
jgi:GTP pyrophosphokinase